jgi:hypothetical protein
LPGEVQDSELRSLEPNPGSSVAFPHAPFFSSTTNDSAALADVSNRTQSPGPAQVTSPAIWVIP